MNRFDFIIVGAGIAGASMAAALAPGKRVLLLERESAPGYHTTGRSAALFSETYGNAVIRRLTAGSRPFFEAPPAGFAAHPLLTPRGCLFVGRADQAGTLAAMALELGAGACRWVGAEEVRRRVPVLRHDYVAGGLLEPDAMDIDVHALHQGFLRMARAAGAVLHTDAAVEGLERREGLWCVRCAGGEHRGAVLVNAAGAWAEEIGRMAGATPVGLAALRRTAILLDPPTGCRPDGWPTVVDADEAFYFKPDAGKILASPADETPSPPCDAQPEELDIAICVDRIQQAADIPVRRVERAWAGLRCFVSDRTPVIGFDTTAPNFFWLAALGGYGIQTAPAAGRLAAALALGGGVPAELAALGLAPDPFSPARFATHQETTR
ncbi:MAG TPA: FAD-binding oxidoreductase [Azospirillaceae bacterium]|nr:FAD-binding oxidoreductase [Azospirillaceae bacterium]